MIPTNLNDDNISLEEHNYDLAGNPIEDKMGVAMIRRLWDPILRVETETYHDINGELIEILYGFCEVRYHLDDNDQLHSAYCYDRQGEIVEEPRKGITHSAQLYLNHTPSK